MKQAISAKAAAALVAYGSTVMIGGFIGVGSPHRLIGALVEYAARGLTIIANDTARPGLGIGRPIEAGCVSRVITSHIGTNPVAQRKMLSGELTVELVPQGTLAERIRAGGAGLGGVLTATGLGTLAGKDRQIVEVDGQSYLVEPALKADVALISARSADYAGNLVYSLTARNFNPLMAMAAGLVIAETNEVVPLGVLAPDMIHTPGVLVDHLLERPKAA